MCIVELFCFSPCRPILGSFVRTTINTVVSCLAAKDFAILLGTDSTDWGAGCDLEAGVRFTCILMHVTRH